MLALKIPIFHLGHGTLVFQSDPILGVRIHAEAKAAIFEYIEVFYNRQRRHSGGGYKTPKQAFEDMTGVDSGRGQNDTLTKISL